MAPTTILDPKVIQEVQHYGHVLEKTGIPFNQLIVFGSHTTDTAQPWSDIDVCVVSKKFGKNRHDERVLLMHAKDLLSLDIEPHPYHPDDLRNKWDMLAREIVTHGIPIHYQ